MQSDIPFGSPFFYRNFMKKLQFTQDDWFIHLLAPYFSFPEFKNTLNIVCQKYNNFNAEKFCQHIQPHGKYIELHRKIYQCDCYTLQEFIEGCLVKDESWFNDIMIVKQLYYYIPPSKRHKQLVTEGYIKLLKSRWRSCNNTWLYAGYHSPSIKSCIVAQVENHPFNVVMTEPDMA